MGQAFFSHVKEDKQQVTEIARAFELNGVSTWVDKDKLIPGQDFHEEIRKAIQSGSFYIDVYSKNRQERERTYANRELIIAIDELQQRGNKAGWYIAITLEECEVPDRDIGANARLSNFQRAHLHTDWEGELHKLLRAVGVAEPQLPERQSLGHGLPASVALSNGRMTITEITPDIPELVGLEIELTTGWCRKTDEGHLLAYLESLAGNPKLQKMNEQLQLSKFHLLSPDAELSSVANSPNEFNYSRSHTFPKGYEAYNIQTDRNITLPMDAAVKTRARALGYMNGGLYLGEFQNSATVMVAGMEVSTEVHGIFEMEWA